MIKSGGLQYMECILHTVVYIDSFINLFNKRLGYDCAKPLSGKAAFMKPKNIVFVNKKYLIDSTAAFQQMQCRLILTF